MIKAFFSSSKEFLLEDTELKLRTNNFEIKNNYSKEAIYFIKITEPYIAQDYYFLEDFIKIPKCNNKEILFFISPFLLINYFDESLQIAEKFWMTTSEDAYDKSVVVKFFKKKYEPYYRTNPYFKKFYIEYKNNKIKINEYFS